LREGRSRTKRGFTLVEIMAVVLIIGLTFGLVMPNLSARRGDQLEQQAMAVVSRIELARERSVLTGTHHRLVVDLESGAFHVEWFVTEERAFPLADPADAPPEELADYSNHSTPISLTPPEHAPRDNYPIPGRFGAEAYMEVGYFFVGLDAPGGWVDEGVVFIVFEQDGTTDFAELVLADEYQNEVVLEIRPLLDQVRIRRRDDDA
jgi:prepilin-type N-terminal cleavage/methylation domain-containing protein